MTINPDEIIYFQMGWFKINATIFFTWLIIIFVTFGSWLITRKMTSEGPLSRWQNLLEVIVEVINNQIREVSRQEPGPYLPFVGTLFLFIAISNVLAIVPGYIAPTSSLSTTAALAISVFIAVPVFGIAGQGVMNYLRQYLQPTFFMLPFNIIGELSRTLALAVRLYGNMMSGTVIVAILLTITPLIFPVVMQALGLLTGLIQAYIFAILAMVYIASASQVHQTLEKKSEQ
ncbi:MAG: F0F1 ATP synthase subunit A [Firmicutes bacterium]|nr:F0F1 ATP synthase subunit A [Bacillota bacterium]